jgi:hypothetical protein
MILQLHELRIGPSAAPSRKEDEHDRALCQLSRQGELETFGPLKCEIKRDL